MKVAIIYRSFQTADFEIFSVISGVMILNDFGSLGVHGGDAQIIFTVSKRLKTPWSILDEKFSMKNLLKSS